MLAFEKEGGGKNSAGLLFLKVGLGNIKERTQIKYMLNKHVLIKFL